MMKRLFRDFCEVIKKHGNLSAIFFVLLLTVIVFVEMITGIGCPIYFVTGISCPGCGMSRALFRVLRFDFAGAFLFHPLWCLLPVLAVFWFLRESARISHKTYGRFLWVFSILFLLVYLFRLLDPADTIVCVTPAEGLFGRIFTGLKNTFLN